MLIPSYSAALNERHGGEGRAPHNTLVMVAVEYGIQGIFMWVMLFVSIFVMLERTRRLAVFRGDDFCYYRSMAVMIALTSALVASIFTDRLYSEAIYWLMAIGIAVHRLAETELHAVASGESQQSRAA